jgi:Acyl-CoA reductase (LuxC)
MTTISITEIVQAVQSTAELTAAAAKLRQVTAEDEILLPNEVISVFDAWAKKLDARELDELPGIPFLRMWLRRGTLEPIIARELGPDALHGGWTESGHAKLRAFPIGVVGHWPAGNVEIQPILSLTCALLGGNAAIVRIPSGLVDLTRLLMEKLAQSDPGGRLTRRIFMASFDHRREDLQAAMARSVDGAMIWGGEEAVLQIRALPFPHWARIAVFGPRISVAAMDAGAWSDPEQQKTWCLRLARDVWQFDQQACSSPQVLFLERRAGQTTAQFLLNLQRAFETENRAHPRRVIPSVLTSTICQARASWLLNGSTHKAVFPASPDWTLLFGSGAELPQPVQGKTLTVLEVDDLLEPIAKWDGNVQTLGLGMTDPEKEKKVTLLSGRRGVDRVVKLGRMHVFVSPWDGMDLIRPMVRMVRHVSSAE